jgi:hypothetical protein
MSKLTPKDIIKLKKLDKDSKWEDLKDVKIINDAIKDLDIYEERIQLGCSRYLSEDVVKSKNFDEDEMFRNCREAEKVKKRVDKKEKKKGGKASMGKAIGTTDKKLLTSNQEEKEKKDKEEKDEKDKKETNKKLDTILGGLFKDAYKKVGEVASETNGNLSDILEKVASDKKIQSGSMEALLGVVMASIKYFYPDMDNGILQLNTNMLVFIGSIFATMSVNYLKNNREIIAWIIGKLKELWRWLKKKGFDFFGWGSGGGGDDGDDGSGGGGRGNLPQFNMSDADIQGILEFGDEWVMGGGGNDEGGEGQGDSSNQQSQEQQASEQQQPQQEVASQQLNYYQQQQNAQIRAMADKGRLETDTMLRQSNPTPQKNTPTKSNDGLVSFKGQQYGKPPDTLDKFKESFNIEETKKIKPDTKDWSDKEFYDFYKEWYRKQTTKDLGNVVDNTPIKAPSASVLREGETSLDPMGNQLDSTEGHTTPSSYWESMANYGEKIHSGVASLNQMGMGLTLGAGLTALHYGTQLVRPALIRSQMEGASSDMSSQSLIKTESRGEYADILHPFYQSGAVGEYIKSRGRPFGAVKKMSEHDERMARLGQMETGRYVAD